MCAGSCNNYEGRRRVFPSGPRVWVTILVTLVFGASAAAVLENGRTEGLGSGNGRSLAVEVCQLGRGWLSVMRACLGPWRAVTKDPISCLTAT